MQLAGQLGIQVAAGVDRRDEGRSGSDSLVCRRAGRTRLDLELREVRDPLPQVLLFPGERLERALVIDDAIAIDARERGGSPICAAGGPQVVDVEEQSPESGLPEFVDAHQALFDFRALRLRRPAQRRRPDLRRRQRLLRGRPVAFGLPQFLDSKLTLDFEASQLHQQRALLRRQVLRFFLQDADPLGGALTRRRAGRLWRRGLNSGERHCGERRNRAGRDPRDNSDVGRGL